MKIIEKSIELDGQKLTLQFGKLAQAVDSSVYATLGDTAVLVTVALGPENPNLDYFPLSVEYAEKLYAGGIIKGSRWVKREGRPSDEAVLNGRIIDRSIRPLFPKHIKTSSSCNYFTFNRWSQRSRSIVCNCRIDRSFNLFNPMGRSNFNSESRLRHVI